MHIQLGRVFHTFCGWRPSEALTVSTVACHHSLSQLLFYCAKKATRASDEFKRASGSKLTEADVRDIQRLNAGMVPSMSAVCMYE